MEISMQKEPTQYKVCIIIPFFGQWPKYFNLFLKSISNTSTLHFAFFTDLEEPSIKLPNVSYTQTTLKDLQKRFSQALGFECVLDQPYKFCDYKPAYGDLFAKEIEGYTHWACGDIDLLYGNVEKFISQDLLASYEVISSRTEHMTGSLSIFSNTPVVNRLYQRSRDYKKVFSSQEVFGFDECNFQWKWLDNNEKGASIEHMTQIVHDAVNEGLISARFETMIKESIPKGDHVQIEDQKVCQKDGKEFLFYHFITEKKSLAFNFASWKDVPETYYITPNGFYKPDQFSGITFQIISMFRVLLKWRNAIRYYSKRLVQKTMERL